MTFVEFFFVFLAVVAVVSLVAGYFYEIGAIIAREKSNANPERKSK